MGLSEGSGADGSADWVGDNGVAADWWKDQWRKKCSICFVNLHCQGRADDNSEEDRDLHGG